MYKPNYLPGHLTAKPMRAYDTRFCVRCQCDRQFSKSRVEHLNYFWFTILTLGLWGIVWLTDAIRKARKPWRCDICHARFIPYSKTVTSPDLPTSRA